MRASLDVHKELGRGSGVRIIFMFEVKVIFRWDSIWRCLSIKADLALLCPIIGLLANCVRHLPLLLSPPHALLNCNYPEWHLFQKYNPGYSIFLTGFVKPNYLSGGILRSFLNCLNKQQMKDKERYYRYYYYKRNILYISGDPDR